MGEPSSATSPIPAKAERAAAEPDRKRRRFLLSLGASSAAVAAAGVPAASGTVALAETAPGEKSSGYRETQHVRDYYRSAKF
ncbi:MAG: transcriptional initiation protein Tat [Burkholderiales bacterium]|nr:transcriptional initiation protein Tat [Burkholderiales bacterium]